MPQRKFANQKALIDYAEQNGLVYVWGWIERQRVIICCQDMTLDLLTSAPTRRDPIITLLKFLKRALGSPPSRGHHSMFQRAGRNMVSILALE